MSNGDQRAAQQQKAANGGAPRMKLMEWHGITVARYENGQCKAWHNRMDMASRRTWSSSLVAPSLDMGSLPWHAQALLEAVNDMIVDIRQEQGLF